MTIGNYATQSAISGTHAPSTTTIASIGTAAAQNNGSAVTATQSVTGDISIAKVEDLLVNNTGVGADGIHIGQTGVQTAKSGLVNGLANYFGGVTTASQTVSGAITLPVTRSAEFRADVTATDSLQIGNNATQTATAADMRIAATGYPGYPIAATATTATVPAPGQQLNVISSQSTGGNISVTAAEIKISDSNGKAVSAPTVTDLLGKAPVAGVQLGNAASITVDTQNSGRASSTSNVGGTLALTTTNPTSAPAQTDTTITTALKGDISVLNPAGAGVAQLGNSSTSAVSHPVGQQPTGTFLAMQLIGDTTNTTLAGGVASVPNTATAPININAYHDLNVTSAMRTARIGDYITETQPLNSTAAVKSPGSLVEQVVSSNINVNVGNSLGAVGGVGFAQIGHDSPSSNAYQVTGTTIVTPQTLAGAITVEVGTTAAKTAVGNTSPADITGGVPAAGALGNNNVLVDASGGGKVRIGSQFASPLAGGTNTTETAQGDIWVRAGSHLKVAGGGTGADIGHGPYDFAAGPGTINPNDAVGGLGTVRNRVMGNTTIGASQNSPLEDSNIAPNYMVFDASAGPVLINSGYGGGGPGLNGDVGGQLRFFIPAQQNLTVVAAPKAIRKNN